MIVYLASKGYLSIEAKTEETLGGLIKSSDFILKKEKDYARSMGKEVEIRTYRPINKEKEFYGILSAYDESSVTITTEEQEEQTFEKADIALIRLAFDF